MPLLNDENLSGKTLIIPVVSTANVAQLSVDLLISSLGLVRIAALDSKYFIPLVGSRENGELGITTPFELYGKGELGIVVLQQRSPILKVMKQEFIDDLFDFVQKSGIADAHTDVSITAELLTSILPTAPT
ncbi:proteasome assembly chaperone 2 [Lentinula edodes]|uniref:Proteasome assembly chaperone 2 n=1 Tax=Lentinula edodes TaxID=5353 RepID=A0A1Q3EAS0_LENED|nr:proteasome assembly chaperone 2 [Lentinula edodes]